MLDRAVIDALFAVDLPEPSTGNSATRGPAARRRPRQAVRGPAPWPPELRCSSTTGSVAKTLCTSCVRCLAQERLWAASVPH